MRKKNYNLDDDEDLIDASIVDPIVKNYRKNLILRLMSKKEL